MGFCWFHVGFHVISCGVFRWPSKRPFVAHFFWSPFSAEHQERLERQVLPIHRWRRWGSTWTKVRWSTSLWLLEFWSTDMISTKKNIYIKDHICSNVKEWRLTFIQMNFKIPEDLTTSTFNRFPILGFKPLSFQFVIRLNRLGRGRIHHWPTLHLMVRPTEC